MAKRLLSATLAVFLLGHPAWAADTGPERASSFASLPTGQAGSAPPPQNTGSGASFDCAKARTAVEEVICKDPYLSKEDQRMATLYKALLARLPEYKSNFLRRQQRDWLKMREQQNKRMLYSFYTDRIEQLNEQYTKESLPPEKSEFKKTYRKSGNGVEVALVEKGGLNLPRRHTYEAESNRWIDTYTKQPECVETYPIGPDKIPGYGGGTSLMQDGCTSEMVILTDQSFAIVISAPCGGNVQPFMEDTLKSLKLIGSVHAIAAKCDASSANHGDEVPDQDNQ
jgi:uncharacterized protein